MILISFFHSFLCPVWRNANVCHENGMYCPAVRARRAHSSQAAPILTVTPGGLNGGNREWIVNIALDTLIDQSVAQSVDGRQELAFSIDDPVDLLNVRGRQCSHLGHAENPGTTRSRGTLIGRNLHQSGQRQLICRLWQRHHTRRTPTHFLTITTAGTGPTTLRYGVAASGHPVLARASPNRRHRRLAEFRSAIPA